MTLQSVVMDIDALFECRQRAELGLMVEICTVNHTGVPIKCVQEAKNGSDTRDLYMYKAACRKNSSNEKWERRKEKAAMATCKPYTISTQKTFCLSVKAETLMERAVIVADRASVSSRCRRRRNTAYENDRSLGVAR